MGKEIVLNQVLTLEDQVHTPDGAGGQVVNWVGLGIIWAQISAKTQRRGKVPGGGFSKVVYRILLRAAPKPSPSRPRANQRFRNGGRIYLIDAVSEYDEAGLYLECWAHEEDLT